MIEVDEDLGRRSCFEKARKGSKNIIAALSSLVFGMTSRGKRDFSEQLIYKLVELVKSN